MDDFPFFGEMILIKSWNDMQEIMTRLREKAHASLQAFKDGRGSPLVRTVALSDDDRSMQDDELAMLGGRTRLVGKGSAPTRPPSPIVVQQSMTSNHLHIPFSLEQGLGEHMHPTIMNYPNAFVPPLPPSHPSASANNMQHLFSPLPDAAAFSASYPSPPVSAESSVHQTPRSLGPSDDTLDTSVFLTYFPGLEYGGSADVRAMLSPIHPDSQIPKEQSAQQNASTRPEVTMESSWQDLIAQFGLY